MKRRGHLGRGWNGSTLCKDETANIGNTFSLRSLVTCQKCKTLMEEINGYDFMGWLDMRTKVNHVQFFGEASGKPGKRRLMRVQALCLDCEWVGQPTQIWYDGWSLKDSTTMRVLIQKKHAEIESHSPTGQDNRRGEGHIIKVRVCESDDPTWESVTIEDDGEFW